MGVLVNNGSTFVGGASPLATPAVASDQWPGPSLADGVDAATSGKTAISVTASATPHTVGSWVEIDPSLSFDAIGIVLWPRVGTATAATESSALLNIGTGASGSESIWATIGAGYGFVTGTTAPIIIPGFIAAGTRTALQVQSAIASVNVQYYVEFIPATKGARPGVPVTYQANTATSRGLTITAPVSLNAKGAWTQMVSSTADPLVSLSVFPQAAGATVITNNGCLIDIGIGASGFEVPIISDLYIFGDTSERYYIRSLMTHGIIIPAGSRISARYARANANNTLDLVLVGTKAA